MPTRQKQMTKQKKNSPVTRVRVMLESLSANSVFGLSFPHFLCHVESLFVAFFGYGKL
jgi:hypothetical protein